MNRYRYSKDKVMSKDIDIIEEFLIFNNPFFTETRVKLNDYEKSFLKNFSKVKFV